MLIALGSAYQYWYILLFNPSPSPHPAHPPSGAVQWSPSRDPALSKRATALTGGPAMPSLLDTCLAVLTDYVDCIETLEGVPDAMKVCARGAVGGGGEVSVSFPR